MSTALDDPSALVAGDDQAVVLEAPQRLAHRRAADLIAVTQLELDQPLARAKLEREDVLLEALVDLGSGAAPGAAVAVGHLGGAAPPDSTGPAAPSSRCSSSGSNSISATAMLSCRCSGDEVPGISSR